MLTININAKIRKNQGKSASRCLRLANKFPAVIYGGNEDPLSIELNHNNIHNIQNKKDFYNNVILLIFEDKEISRITLL